jgi:hypothetical protein
MSRPSLFSPPTLNGATVDDGSKTGSRCCGRLSSRSWLCAKRTVSPSMTRNCILMGVFSQMVTMPLLTAHSSASRCSGFASAASGQTANVSIALPPQCLPVSDCLLPAIVTPGGARSYLPRDSASGQSWPDRAAGIRLGRTPDGCRANVAARYPGRRAGRGEDVLRSEFPAGPRTVIRVRQARPARRTGGIAVPGRR